MNLIITIAREYGSGGDEVAEKLAKKLGVNCYDEKLLEIAAKESGINPAFFEDEDIKEAGGFLSALNIQESGSDHIAGFGGVFDRPATDDAFYAVWDTIEELAQKESCVIVGRCAEFALRKYDNVISVYIGARRADRIKWVQDHFDLSEKDALARIDRYDKRKDRQYKYYTDREGDEARNFNLSMNCSVIGTDGCVELILDFLKLAEQNKKD